ncbi:hypothetical protein pb186bvf_013955 [Paramecium bursaria]
MDEQKKRKKSQPKQKVKIQQIMSINFESLVKRNSGNIESQNQSPQLDEMEIQQNLESLKGSQQNEQDQDKRFSFSQPFNNIEINQQPPQEQQIHQEDEEKNPIIDQSQDISLFQSKKLSIKSEKLNNQKPFTNKKVASINNMFDNFLKQRQSEHYDEQHHNEGLHGSQEIAQINIQQNYNEDIIEFQDQNEQLQNQNEILVQEHKEEDLDDLIELLYDQSKRQFNHSKQSSTHQQSPSAIQKLSNQKQQSPIIEIEQQLSQFHQILEMSPGQEFGNSYEQQESQKKIPLSEQIKQKQLIHQQKEAQRQYELNQEQKQQPQDNNTQQANSPPQGQFANPQNNIQQTLKDSIKLVDQKQTSEQIPQNKRVKSDIQEVTFRKQDYQIMTISKFLFKYNLLLSQSQIDILNKQDIQIYLNYYQQQALNSISQFDLKNFSNQLQQENYEFWQLCNDNFILCSEGIKDSSTKWSQTGIKKDNLLNYLRSLGYVITQDQANQIIKKTSEFQKEVLKIDSILLNFQCVLFAIHQAQFMKPVPQKILATLQFFSDDKQKEIEIQKTKDILSNTAENCSHQELEALFEQVQGSRYANIEQILKLLCLLPF